MNRLLNPLPQTVKWLQTRCKNSDEFQESVQVSFLYSLSRFIGACLREGIFDNYSWQQTTKAINPTGFNPSNTRLLLLRGSRGRISFLTNVSRDPLYLEIVMPPELVTDGHRRVLSSAKQFFKALSSIGLDQPSFPRLTRLLFENSQAHLLIGFGRTRNGKPTDGETQHTQDDDSHRDASCIYGHPFYPFPKLREGFGLRDSLLYSNEGRKGVLLSLLAVPKSHSVFSCQKYENSYEFFCELLSAETDLVSRSRNRSDDNIIPVHPWQIRNVPFVKHLLDQKIVYRLPGALCGKPLVSLRTLHIPSCRLDLKVSLSTRITSEKRTIQQFQSQNAPIISAILARLIKSLNISSLRLQEDIASIRFANFAHGSNVTAIFRGQYPRSDSEDVLPANYLYDGITINASASPIVRVINSYEKKWGKSYLDFFRRYARILIEGPITLLQVGVGMEPHLQNCLVVFESYQPKALILRDTDTANLIPQKISTFFPISKYPWYPETWDLMQSERFSIARLWHAAIRSHMGSLIHTISVCFDEDEDFLWRELRSVMEEIFAQLGPVGNEDLGRLAARFFQKYEPIKCLLRMKLSGSERFVFRRKVSPLWRSP